MPREYTRSDRRICLEMTDFLAHSARLASMVVMLDTSAPLYVKIGGAPAAHIDRRGATFVMIPHNEAGLVLCDSLSELIGERAQIPEIVRRKISGVTE